MFSRKNLYSAILVAFQFSCLGYLLLTGPVFVSQVGVLVAQVSGLILLAWAVLSMNFETLNVFPVVRKSAKFVCRGPYRLIRHPMYLSLFLFFIPLIVVHFSWERLISLVVLFTVLVIKIDFEEKLLQAKFPYYSTYRESTYRFIPYIY